MQQRCDDAADQVNADHVQRVVVVQPTLQPTAYEQTTPAARPTASAPSSDTDPQDGDGHQTRDRARGGAEGGGLPSRLCSTKSQPSRPGAAGGEGVEEGGGGESVGAQRGPGVEAEPAEPQQPRAQHHHRQLRGWMAPLLQAETGAEDETESQAGSAGGDRPAACPRSPAPPASPGPSPRIRTPSARLTRPDGPDRHEHQPRRELRALGIAPADQRGGDDREGELEGGEEQGGHGPCTLSGPIPLMPACRSPPKATRPACPRPQGERVAARPAIRR